MMYLMDLPSLSSLNVETHSGETETLVIAVVSVNELGISLRGVCALYVG